MTACSGPLLVTCFFGCVDLSGLHGGETSSGSSGSAAEGGGEGATVARAEAGLDGDLLPDGASPDGNVVSKQCPGVAACERVVFVTSSSITGNMGGAAGADAKCQLAADQSTSKSVHGRLFRAWLADDFSTVDARLVQGTKPYRRADGSMLAISWAQLFKNHLTTLSLNESGAEVGPVAVWTGVNGVGGRGLICQGWTSGSPLQNGTRGDTAQVDAAWTDNNFALSCDSSAHLYCFEQ